MDFDESLTKLQGSLMSLGNRNMLNCRDLSKPLETLRGVFQHCSDQSKSKMTFFMLLNTRLGALRKLKDDKNVGLLTDITPQINKDQLISFIYELNLQPCLCEIIEHCPAELSIDLLEAVLRKFRDANFHKDSYGIEHIYKLWRSVFIKIYKLEKGIHKYGGSEKLTHYFEELFIFISKVLKTSLVVKRDRFVEFVGNHFYNLFNVILFCLNLYISGKPDFESNDIYELTIDLNCRFHDRLREPTKRCINLVFRKISGILEFLTVDTWMSLSDCYLNNNSDDSLQRLIGETVYEICEVLKSRKMYLGVLTHLAQCKIKPRAESDKMAEASIDEIMDNIENGKSNWFKALIRHPLVLEGKKSIRCVSKHLDMASEEDISFILESCLEHLTINWKKQKDYLNSVKGLFLTSLKRISEEECNMWLGKVFSNYKPKFLETSTCNDELVATFNKIAHENVNVRDIICLFVQSPKETLKKICEFVICDVKQVDLCLEVMKSLKVGYEALHAFYPADKSNLLDVVLLDCLLPSDLTEKEKRGFLLWVMHLGEQNLIGETFLKSLLECLREQLGKESLEKAVFCLEIFQLFPEVVGTYAFCKPIVLVFLSQVLNRLTWDLKTFSSIKSDGRDLVSSIVSSLISKLKDEDVPKLEWVRYEVLKRPVVNQVYFCDLWFRYGLDWSGLGKFHDCILTLPNTQVKADYLQGYLAGSYLSRPSDVRTSIILSLTMLLPVLTFREWHSIFQKLTVVSRKVNETKKDFDFDEDILSTFASAVYLLTLKLNVSRDFLPCYEQCVRNFGRLANQWSFKASVRSSIRIFEKILFFLKAIENKEVREICVVILSPVFLNLVETASNLEEGDSTPVLEEKLITLVDLVDVKEVAEALKKKLLPASER